jgi:hypothetical protein
VSASSRGTPPRDVRRYAAEAPGTATLVLVGAGAATVAASTPAFGHTGWRLTSGWW